MNVVIDLQLLAVGIAGMAMLFAGGTFWRTGDWRKSDTWKTLTDLVAALASRVTVVEGRTSEIPTKIGSINDRLTRVEAHLDQMPSKADIASLSAKIDAVGDEADVIRSAVVRIEQFMMGDKS